MSDETTKCKGCGVAIRFVRSAKSGKQIPLQQIRSVYTIDESGRDPIAKRLPLQGNIWVSHFEMCPAADQFSGTKRKTS